MGKFDSKERNRDANLSLDKYIEQLKDYKEKAAKVFQMSGSNSYSAYVLSALQYAIDVAQGKNVTNEDRVAVLKSAEELTKNALSFHNKFAKVRENIERKSEEKRVASTQRIACMFAQENPREMGWR